MGVATIDQIEREIVDRALDNAKDRLSCAARARDYYELQNHKYIERRDAENELDYLTRPKPSLPFLRRVVRMLCKHLYAPGPARSIRKDRAAGDWRHRVYADCPANS